MNAHPQHKPQDSLAKQGRVILTSGRSLMALAAAHSLGKRGIEIIGADCVKMTTLYFSRYVRKNEIYANYQDNPEKFISDLLTIVKRYKPKDERPYLLMPTLHETFLIARHKEIFEPFISVGTPAFELINQVHPKHHLVKTARRLGVNTPLTFLPETNEQVKAYAEKLGFPHMVKPYDSAGGKGISVVHNQQELEQAFEEIRQSYHAPPLMQELVEGEDYCITLLFRQGELKASMGYKNLRHFPAEAGQGVVRETIDEKPFIEVAKQLFGPLQWNGVTQMDFVWDENPRHEPRLIEVNPRFWAGLFQSVYSGVDYPWLNYLLHTGQTLPPAQDASTGTKTKIPLIWMLSAVEDSINLESSFTDISQAGSKALSEVREGNLLKAFRLMTDGLKKGLNFRTGVKNLSNALEEAQDANSELFSTDDPQAAMGVLYALAYLIKYKKLPPEIEF